MRKSKGNFTGWLQQVVSFSVHACMHAFTAGHWYMIWSMSRPQMDVRTYVRTYVRTRRGETKGSETTKPIHHKNPTGLFFLLHLLLFFAFLTPINKTREVNDRSPASTERGDEKREENIYILFSSYFSLRRFSFSSGLYFFRGLTSGRNSWKMTGRWKRWQQHS